MAAERALVTGGAGFIGSSVVEALGNRGTSVLVVDDLSTGSAANLHHVRGDVEMVKVDIRDAALVRQAFDDFRPDVVFHLAARTDVRASMADPHDDASVNVLGSINVFAAAARVRARRVVNTSTGGAIYSPAAPIPTPETAPVAPLSAYGLSKRVVEEYADWFRSSSGLDVVTLRYGNVYGPRQDPTGDAGVVAIFCERLLAGRRPVVFGDGTADPRLRLRRRRRRGQPRRGRDRGPAPPRLQHRHRGRGVDPRVGEGDGGGRGRRSTSRPAAAGAGPPR